MTLPDMPQHAIPVAPGPPPGDAPGPSPASAAEAVLAETARRRRRRRLILGAVAVLSAVASAVGYLVLRPAAGPLEGVLTAEVRRGDVEDTITALGRLQPREFVDVGAQVSGQLKRIAVAVGDVVREGDLLAEIDPTVLVARVEAGRAELRNLRAQLREQEAQRDLAARQFRRQQQLMRENATSRDALETAEAGYQAAVARLAALKAQIEQRESTLKGDEATLGYTRIYTPMSGTVVSIAAQQGQTLNANQQAPIIMRIADLSTMTVRTQVSEADVSKLAIGMDVYFVTLGDRASRWPGKLRQILPVPEVLNNVVLYTALFEVANPSGDLMAEMSAQVFFVRAAARGVLTVPVSALGPVDESQGIYRVSVARGDGTVERRRVKIGVKNRIRAEAVSGLEAGERVIAGRSRDASAGSGRQQRGRRFRF